MAKKKSLGTINPISHLSDLRYWQPSQLATVCRGERIVFTAAIYYPERDREGWVKV